MKVISCIDLNHLTMSCLRLRKRQIFLSFSVSWVISPDKLYLSARICLAASIFFIYCWFRKWIRDIRLPSNICRLSCADRCCAYSLANICCLLAVSYYWMRYDRYHWLSMASLLRWQWVFYSRAYSVGKIPWNLWMLCAECVVVIAFPK